MSATTPLYPALALLELGSIAIGIRCGDAMVKRSPVELLSAGTVHPGKYLVLVAGEVAHVDEARLAGLEHAAPHLLDAIYLPQANPQVLLALAGRRQSGDDDALGVVETTTAASLLGAADRAVKTAAVTLRELRLADDLGGRAYCLLSGTLTDVEAAVDAALEDLAPERLVASEVIARLHPEMRERLDSASRLVPQLPRHGALGAGGGC